jgi:uncharacterized protein YjiS (DUF1127 family)
MHFSHLFLHRIIDFCGAAIYLLPGLGEGAIAGSIGGGRNQEGGQLKETAMKFSLSRFLRVRRVYWSVLQELSAYTDRELHDIGIDRADIHEIARLASREER